MASRIRRDQKTYLRLVRYIAPYKARFLIALFASLPASAIDGAGAYIIGPFIDRMLKGGDYSFLFYVPVVIILATALQGTCQYISSYYSNYIGLAITQDLANQLYNKLLQMDFGYFKSQNSGDIVARYNNDPSRLQTAIVQSFQEFIVQFFSLICLAAVLFYRNWHYALLSLAIISFIVIPLNIVSKKVRRLDYKSTELTSKILTLYYDSIHGIRVVKVFALYDYLKKRFAKDIHDSVVASLRISKAQSLLKPILQLITTVGLSVIITFGSLEVMHRHMTPGDLASFLIALILLYKPVKAIGSLLGKVQLMLAPAERVFEKLDLAPALAEPRHPVPVDHVERLTFEHVWFAYDGASHVLQDIHFEATAGQTIALVGTSGGGKTTLVDLIPRFMDPTQGRVLLNGHDLKTVSSKNLMKLIAIVAQDTILFEGTIRENVMLGKLTATEAELDRAVASAYLTDWVASLPEGLDTPIGERGNKISGGQKQRIAIARAFLKNAPILILDEATSALDNESEAMVQRALNHLFVGRTTFVIAHRLSTVQHADRILVVQQGEIVESGTHDALMDHNGVYAHLYNIRGIESPIPASL